VKSFEKLVTTVAKLRAPDGCPWDRAQDHKTLRKHLLEETHEVLELLDQDERGEKWSSSLKEELGDLLLQILLHSQMAHEKKLFSMEDVVTELNEKLIRRHPHVFADKKVKDADEALKTWDAQKAIDQKGRKTLDGIPAGLPSLQKAQKVIEKVSKVGFQWENMSGPWEKLEEEVRELKAELDAIAPLKKLTKEKTKKIKNRKKLESELGDVLFSIANICHFTHTNPEDALRTMLARFSERFQHVESEVSKRGKKWSDYSLKELDKFWEKAKKR
jgi:tetrapyrrole methylase family protein/MazG family protein